MVQAEQETVTENAETEEGQIGATSPVPPESAVEEEILERCAWFCACGEAFPEPEELQGHVTRERNRGSSSGEHSVKGYGDPNSEEIALPFSTSVWRGQWRQQLKKLIEQGEFAESGPEDTDDDLQEVKPGKGRKGQHQVKVQYRPKVFEMDESVVHIYHLHMAAAQRLGVRYEPSLGEWIRQVVFQFSLEHPELVDLSSILSPDERQQIAAAEA